MKIKYTDWLNLDKSKKDELRSKNEVVYPKSIGAKLTLVPKQIKLGL